MFDLIFNIPDCRFHSSLKCLWEISQNSAWTSSVLPFHAFMRRHKNMERHWLLSPVGQAGPISSLSSFPFLRFSSKFPWGGLFYVGGPSKGDYKQSWWWHSELVTDPSPSFSLDFKCYLLKFLCYSSERVWRRCLLSWKPLVRCCHPWKELWRKILPLVSSIILLFPSKVNTLR